MIIGRTNLRAELKSNKYSLTKEKYYFISHISRQFLIDNSITRLPVCINEIIKNNGWKVLTYSKLKGISDKKFIDIMKQNLGFTILTDKLDYIIVYDESRTIETQRFTISHEIGHIVLSHFQNMNENREQEANMFAARLLMPMCVLYECNIKSSKDVEELCYVSSISAKYRYKRLKLLKKRKKFYTDINEIKVYNNFKDFIKEREKDLIQKNKITH